MCVGARAYVHVCVIGTHTYTCIDIFIVQTRLKSMGLQALYMFIVRYKLAVKNTLLNACSHVN